MQAVVASSSQPVIEERPEPEPGPEEVLLRVRAAGLNRADLLQLQGRYPPPSGESDVLGLEAAGEIVALGPGVESWEVGQRAMALLAGGGLGEWVVVPVGQLMPIPAGLGFIEAAALPEAALTAWTNLVHEGGLAAGETVLITAAASGIGCFAVQLARELGARVAVAGRNLDRLEALEALGAEVLLPLATELPQELRRANGGKGADLVLEMAGGRWLPVHLAALEPRGRLVLVGLLAGGACELDLGLLLSRRLRLVGSVLRSRSRAEKAMLVGGFTAFGLPRLADGRLKPVVDRTFPLARVAEAYQALARGGVLGKIVVEIGE